MNNEYPALTKAAEVNAEIIFYALEDGAVPTLGELRRICAANGYADELSVDLALRKLISNGLVVKVTDDGGFTTYARTFLPRGAKCDS